MTALTQAVSSNPTAVVAVWMTVAAAGPVGMLVALRQRGWTPMGALRRRLSARR